MAEMIWLYYLIAILLVVLFIGLLIAAFFTLLYVLPMAKGAVYVPSTPAAIAAMIKLGKIGPGVRVADLGSGDGRVVVALAQAGAIADGYEVNPLLVWRAKRNIIRAGVSNRAKIWAKSYWDVDLGIYDVVIVYGITYIMKDLSRKLKSELKPKSRVVSNYFKLPNWRISASQDRVHLYQK